jgi:hypothetical protein
MSIQLPTSPVPSKFCVAAALAIAILPACSSQSHEQPQPDAPAGSGACPTELVAQLDRSWWVFTGTVTALHQATVPPPPDGIDPYWDTSKQASLQVTDVASAPSEEPLLIGEHDSIQFHDVPTFDVGYQGHFLVSPYYDGDSHLFWEEGHLDASAIPTDQFDAWVHTAMQYNADHTLYERMVNAQAVAVVTVLDAAELPGQLVSDNLPDWWQAHVTVQTIVTGSLPAGPIPVRFDHSDSFCCYQKPKLAPGDQAIVILYPDGVTGLPGMSYAISDPLDLHPVAMQQELAALLAAPPTCPSLP